MECERMTHALQTPHLTTAAPDHVILLRTQCNCESYGRPYIFRKEGKHRT